MEVGDVKRLTLQESINTSIAKMTELLAGPLEMMASLISNAGVLYGIMGAIGAVMVGQILSSSIEFGKTLITAIPKLATILGLESGIAAAKISGAMAATVGLGAIAIIAGIAAGVGAMRSSMKDGIIDPSKGPVMTGDFGSVQLDPKDKAMYGADGKIKVGTNLNPTQQVRSPQQTVVQQSSPSIDYDRMAQALSRVQVNTNIDGVKVSNQLFNKPSAGMAIRKI
jgi:hypothetical protein